MKGERRNVFKRYLLMKPSKRGTIEWGILAFSVFFGFYFKILPIPFSKYFLWIGILLFIIGGWIHGLSHRYHKQAHDNTEKIERIVTEGIYSKIRHPGYLGLMLNSLGFALLWGSLLPVIIAVFISIGYVLTALEEEKYLLEKFGRDYEKYMRDVKWRFIPRIF